MTTMTTAQLPTIQNTPRDVSKIAPMGVFGHRKLAEQLASEGLPLWSTEMEKSAFITADQNIRAQRLLEALQRYDATRGGQPAAVAAPMQQMAMPQPMMMPPQQPAGMMQPPVQAPPAAEPPREPSTEGSKRGKSNGAGGAELKMVLEQLSTISTGLGQITQGLNDGLKNTNENVNDLRGRLQVIQNVQHVMLGILTCMAQNYLQASGNDLLEVAIAQANETVQGISKMGKAQ